jgi:hypothetical protein
MGVGRHPHRSCTYQEGQACVQRSKDQPEIINAQMAHYANYGLPPMAGMVETGILSRTNTAAVRAFCIQWYAELLQWSRRDQLAFNYVLWRTHLDVYIYDQARIKPQLIELIKHGR